MAVRLGFGCRAWTPSLRISGAFWLSSLASRVGNVTSATPRSQAAAPAKIIHRPRQPVRSTEKEEEVLLLVTELLS